MGSVTVLPMPSIYYLDITNQQYITCGPVVDGLSVVNGVVIPSPTYVIDLAITVSLYMNRDITNPILTPGTTVSAFGSLSMTYTGSSGIYRVTSASFSATPGGNYVLVFDAPVSNSGYQFHIEKTCVIENRQN